MYICKECHFQLPTIEALCCHLRIIHSYNAFNVYKCAQIDCSREYNSIKTFKKHLRDKHSVHNILDEMRLRALNEEHLAEVNENIELNFDVPNVHE